MILGGFGNTPAARAPCPLVLSTGALLVDLLLPPGFFPLSILDEAALNAFGHPDPAPRVAVLKHQPCVDGPEAFLSFGSSPAEAPLHNLLELHATLGPGMKGTGKPQPLQHVLGRKAAKLEAFLQLPLVRHVQTRVHLSVSIALPSRVCLTVGARVVSEDLVLDDLEAIHGRAWLLVLLLPTLVGLVLVRLEEFAGRSNVLLDRCDGFLAVLSLELVVLLEPIPVFLELVHPGLDLGVDRGREGKALRRELDLGPGLDTVLGLVEDLAELGEDLLEAVVELLLLAHDLLAAALEPGLNHAETLLEELILQGAELSPQGLAAFLVKECREGRMEEREALEELPGSGLGEALPEAPEQLPHRGELVLDELSQDLAATGPPAQGRELGVLIPLRVPNHVLPGPHNRRQDLAECLVVGHPDLGQDLAGRRGVLLGA
mmetsp:Transcript_12227/g.35369  ORF Transcript_12227/g.35369 Transcript_12227/m.35369 type:complete len:432 (-) Transcript_12227:1224-2519(-)